MYDLLSSCPLFIGMPANEIERSLGLVPHQRRSYAKGELIAMSNETCTGMIVLLSGNVKAEMVDSSGKVVKIEDIAAPRPIAPAFLFGKENRFPVDVTALEVVETLYIPKQSFVLLMQSSERVLLNYLNMISNRAHFLSSRIYFLSLKSLKAKLAFYLLDLAKPDKTEVELTQTQQDIADYFGVARPSLARTFGELEEEGLIRVDRKKVSILNRDGLARVQ